ncbi:MFS transporter [Mycobacterium sp. 852013-51886_SCH5428379]|uniref:MFS transporter n=1 Tax=Mycobacterium sp. 852013-51886_SCH5428379 TaxID=1834111 RepID=UPI001E2E158C|nr:MFS transporter [Mycobacterium sp. 852013-51886_SCH5428379]
MFTGRVQVTERRVAVTLWCAGLAVFSVMYAPQGLLTEICRDTGVDASRASLLVSAATLGLAVSVLGWAKLANRFGTSVPLRVAGVGAAVTSVAVPWLPSFEAMVAGRLVQGVALGGIPALVMALPHQFVPAKRAAVLGGSYIAATSLGGLSGRLLVVPIAEQWGWRTALFLLGCLVAALMAALSVMTPPTPRAARADGQRHHGHLRDPAMLCLFGIGGLLIGGMVVVFNYLPFRLEERPYLLSPTVISLIFLAYLAGTVGSRVSGLLTGRAGRRPVLVAACVLMGVGALITLAGPLPLILTGVVVLTAGLFVGHAVASSMVAERARHARNQAMALYNISYYAGSSVFGFVGGLAWVHGHWTTVVAFVVALGVAAGALVGKATGASRPMGLSRSTRSNRRAPRRETGAVSRRCRTV